MKWIVITFFLLFISLLVYASYPYQEDKLLTDETRILHDFIQYEYDFYKVNHCNQNPKTCHGSTLTGLNSLLSKLAQSSNSLNTTLTQVARRHPYITTLRQDFLTWKGEHETKLLKGEYLLYWQVELLKYQVYIDKLLNADDSALNADIMKMLPPIKAKLKTEPKAVLCEFANQFGSSAQPKQIAQSVAAIEMAKHYCLKKDKVGKEKR